jgi:hypothetical protein
MKLDAVNDKLMAFHCKPSGWIANLEIAWNRRFVDSKRREAGN